MDLHALVEEEIRPHAAEQLHRGGDVVQVGQVSDRHGTVGEQGRGQDRECGVLRSGGPDFAEERNAAGDDQLVHRRSPAGGQRFISDHRSGVQVWMESAWRASVSKLAPSAS